MSWKIIKQWVLILSIMVNLTTIGKFGFEIYKKVGAEMLPWLIIAAIGIISLILYFYASYKYKLEQSSIKDEQENKLKDDNKEKYDNLKNKMDLLEKNIADEIQTIKRQISVLSR